MTITLELDKALEQEIERHAADSGMSPERFIVYALEAQLRPPLVETPALSPRESHLLQQIDEGFPAAWWDEFKSLQAQRRDTVLSDAALRRFIEMAEEQEAATARRIAFLIELAALRGTSLDAVMADLNLPPSADG